MVRIAMSCWYAGECLRATRASRGYQPARIMWPRHCEERSDEAIQLLFLRHDGLLRFPRNNGGAYCFASLTMTKLDLRVRQTTRRANHFPIFETPCPAPREKIFRFRRRANQWFDSARLTQMRGGSRSSRTLRWDAVDAGAAADERGSSGRRSRVVLTPRRWRQALWR